MKRHRKTKRGKRRQGETGRDKRDNNRHKETKKT